LGPLIKIFCKNMSPTFYRMLSRTSRSESWPIVWIIVVYLTR
jgi:hypothetical protein